MRVSPYFPYPGTYHVLPAEQSLWLRRRLYLTFQPACRGPKSLAFSPMTISAQCWLHFSPSTRNVASFPHTGSGEGSRHMSTLYDVKAYLRPAYTKLGVCFFFDRLMSHPMRKNGAEVL